MKYTVVGAGAMGLRYGILLQENAGVSVDYVEPTQASLDKIRQQDNKVWKSRDHKDRHQIKINIFSPEEYEGDPDVWIFFMKQMQLQDTLDRLAPKFKAGQTALGAMNGMGHIEKLQHYFDDEHIIGGTAMIATVLNDYGDVDFMGAESAGSSVYANLTEKPSEVMDQVQKDFQAAHLNPSYTENFMGTLLTKVFFNAVENSIATMFQSRMGQLMAYDGFLEGIARPLVNEAYDAAEAAGIQLIESRDDMVKQVDYVSNVANPLHFPSMYQDFVKGRPTEVDYINGWIADLADKNGTQAPNQHLVTNFVHLAEAMRKFTPPVNKLSPDYTGA
ncbi:MULTISPECIES: ketopantoate reductase family protein [Leuconostoc]|uniref:2-dehydropantoate 2-reductase n=1 Tax=Leuconostoc pseudomesenteroides TaxID=33968 RepID=A0A1X0VEE1_LEUPS|nr:MULTISPECIES: ketopantoate reductase family protein [Leuconostoc]KDA47582.1 2-dehydropantoate 2-reductase [Leuconostoc pseudomesenteroides 1159]KDA50465.1 2-dehydropantoate 2-reductase [Leuconostoc pseudomesenteroides PS12]CCJ66454.1 2-dehydropantoate 2-reductase [Leuconostoc pseudomesenteroides 4882]MCT4419710.1 ketopantoate reductase family protein [Leuconostoc falkenbergense]MDG9744847.1 ketopantoate reductase family protein [Leuconostoc falkenbergense]